MSDGLIMKGSPPSSGRRTSSKQEVSRGKAAPTTQSSSRKPVAKAASATAGRSAPSKVAKRSNTRPAKPAPSKLESAKTSALKKSDRKAVVAKAPKSPAKASAAKTKKPETRAAPVKRVAVDAKSGVKMKGNSAPDKTSKPDRTGGDRKTSTAPVVVAMPKASPAKIAVPENYKPTDTEPFMNPLQRHYFRLKLLNWKEEILRQTRETLQGMHDETTQYADLADRATSETDRALELRARDRQRKLISKIDAALARIEDGTYGYCEETGEPIGLKRLDARPIATLSLEAQERHERRERVHRGD